MNDTTPQSRAQRPDAATYMSLFEDDATRCAPGAPMANNSRTAYLVHLKELILAFENGAEVSASTRLAARRPDLLALTLGARSASKALPKIRRVLNLLESRAKEALADGQLLQQAVAQGSYQANVPFHHAWESIKATLAIRALSPWKVLSAARTDQPAFAFDNLTQPDHRAATALCAGGSPQWQALLREGDSGPALASVATTRQLTRALGTTRRELRRLLAVDAVGVDGGSVARSAHVPSAAAASSKAYGAAFVNAGGTPLYLSEAHTQASGKPSVRVEGLTQAHLDRLYAALRVQRALTLSAAETDVLLMAAMHAEGQADDYRVTEHTLRALGLFQHLRAMRKVTALQYAALLDRISPYAVQRQTPFYDTVFAPVRNDQDTGTDPVLSLDGGAFDPLASDGEDGLTLKRLALGLKVDEALLRVILGWVVQAQGLERPARSLEVVSACYRITTLARLFGTSTPDGLALLELLMSEQPAYRQQLAGIPRLGTADQPDIVDVIGAIAQATGWMRQQGLTAEHLARLVNPRLPQAAAGWEKAFQTDAPVTDKPEALAQALCLALGLEATPWVAPLLRWAKVDGAALAARIDAIALTCPAGSSPLSQFSPGDYQQWNTLQRYAEAVKTFKLSSDALAQITANPAWFDLQGPGTQRWRALDLTTVYQLGRYKALLAQLAPERREHDALTYLADFDAQANGPVQGARAQQAWTALELLLGRPAGSLAAVADLEPPTTLRGLDRLLRLTALADRHGLSLDTLLDLGKLPQAAADDYASFQKAAVGLRKACSAAQRQTLDEHMSLAWRDALLQWMLDEWVPLDAARHWITSPQALADYLLVDLQVSHEPLTTQLLSATASLQRYLHQIHSRLENGYRHTALSDRERDDWEGFSSSYERWKLRQDAYNEPQNFIDPTRRQRKTKAFAELETQLGQGKCRPEDIQAAMLSYLSTFETLSNIQPISVYADGISPLTDTYHFIGKTNVEPAEYYWRTLDMSQRDPTGAPSMLAWGEWEKITLTVNGEMAVTPLVEDHEAVKEQAKAAQKQTDSTKAKADAEKPATAVDSGTALTRAGRGRRDHIDLIRPVIIAGRRYAVWVERDTTAIPFADNKPSPYFALRVCFSYEQTDGTWTPANQLLCLDGHDEQGTYTAPTPDSDHSHVTAVDNRYLKTRGFKPGLMVMVNIEGDRVDDPWLTVMLFDASPRAHQHEADHFLVMRDLLLLEDKSLDIGTANHKPIHENFARNWLILFSNPATVQHRYDGALRELIEQPGTKLSVWSPQNAHSTLSEQFDAPPLGEVALDAALSSATGTLQITGIFQHTWVSVPTSASPWIGLKAGTANTVASFKLEQYERENDPDRYDYVLKYKRTSVGYQSMGGFTLTIVHDSPEKKTRKNKLVFIIKLENDQLIREARQVANKLEFNTYKSTAYFDHGYDDPNSSETGKIEANIFKKNVVTELRSVITIQSKLAPHARWELPAKDTYPLDTPHLRHLINLPNTDLKKFNSLKTVLFQTRYTRRSQAEDLPSAVPETKAHDRISFTQAIAMAQASNSLSETTRVVALIDEEIQQIRRSGSGLAIELLKEALQLRHFYPEQCAKIFLYLDPSHEIVFEDTVLRNESSTPTHRYPINVDLSEFTVTLEVFDPHVNNEPLASAEAVYTLKSKYDDSVPSVFIRHNDQQAVYLDLSEANRNADPVHRLSVQTLRLNTLFGKQLVALATQSVDRALSWQAQHLPEPALESGTPPTTVDFRSANGLYFWELFFHVPFLVVWLQRQNREYAQAWRWCTRYLFDPYRTSVAATDQPPPFWLTRPLLSQAAYAVPERANDPDLLAYADPERYRKALHLFVVQTWQRQGDDQYRLLTPDSLVEAALCYDKALRLIGVLPEQLSSAPAKALELAEARSGDFTPPLNNALIELRNLLRNRLFNLRHGLTLDGKPATLMLEPEALERLALGQGNASLDRRKAGVVARTVPPCHYDEVRKCAGEAVLQLIELGQTQLRFYESEAAQQLALASKTHIIQLLEFPCRLEQQALQLARRERETVLASQQMLQAKQDYYQGLVDEGITDLETAAMVLGGVSQTLYASSMPFEISAGIAASIPTIYGLAFGGAQPGQPMARTSAVLKSLGRVSELVSDDLRVRAEYQLRSQQWQFEADQASFELKIVEQHLLERDIHIRAATIALEEARTRLATHRAEYDIMTSVFTSRPTYLWLIGRMSEIYSSAYDATLSLCLMAEACLQYELGDFHSTWIKTDGWLDNWRGMLAGEALERDLIQMDVAAIRDNHRPLDIHAEFSLLALNGWSQAKLGENLRSGVISFELTAELFDKHYPGHYLRRIERIWLTFKAGKVPASTSPSAILQQTANRVLLKEDIEGVKHLYAVDEGNGSAVLRDLRPNQSIAVWAFKEVHRNYDLQPSIPDKTRYQPFEGTGLLSSWSIEFPSGAEDNPQLFTDGDCKLEDITVHVIYSAVAGSERFRDEVKEVFKAHLFPNIDPAAQPGGPAQAPGNADNALVSAKEAEQAALAASKAAAGSAEDPALAAADAAAEKRQAVQAVAEAQAAAAQATAARKNTQAAATAGKYAEAEREAAKAELARTKALAAARAATAARDAARSRDRKRRDDALNQARAAERAAEVSAQAARQATDSEVFKSPEVSGELKTAQAAAAQAGAAAKQARTSRENVEQAAQTDTMVAEAAKAEIAAEKARAAAVLAQQARATAQAKIKAAAEAKEKEQAANEAKNKEETTTEVDTGKDAATDTQEKADGTESTKKESAHAAKIIADSHVKVVFKDLLKEIEQGQSDVVIRAHIERIEKKYVSAKDFEARRALMHAKVYACLWRVHLATTARDAASSEGRKTIASALAQTEKVAGETGKVFNNYYAIAASSAALAFEKTIDHQKTRNKDVQTAIDYLNGSKNDAYALAILKAHLNKVLSFKYKIPLQNVTQQTGRVLEIDEEQMTFDVDEDSGIWVALANSGSTVLYITQMRVPPTDITPAIPAWNELSV